MKDIIMIQDLQFGSTGKGQIAGALAHVEKPDTVVTAWGPNAGHTFRSGDFKMVTTMLATSAIAPSVRNILIGPGSILKVTSLIEEIRAVQHLLEGKTLVIHPQAMIWTPAHAEAEKQLLRVGSTMKGTGEALVSKIRRYPEAVAAGRALDLMEAITPCIADANMSLLIDEEWYDHTINESEKLIVEGAQGFSLGIHTRFFPHCTSRDVSTAQSLADCRIPFPRRRDELRVVGVCRTYPIRVANRFDSAGNMVGTSGGCYPDQDEIEWKVIEREPELTTVTKLPRRLFSFSQHQIAAAVRIMDPDDIALTFCDYLEPPVNGEGDLPRVVVPNKVRDLVSSIEYTASQTVPGIAPLVRYFSFGPTMQEVYVRDDEFVLNSQIKPLV